jgi:uncharacterized phage protein (TIGR02220 family)
MTRTYHFDQQDAERYGVEEAVMLYNLRFWCDKNRANGKNIHEARDGQQRAWTYNSVRAFQDLFPFWTAAKVRRILQKLYDAGAIDRGHFNKVAYDRTLWYTVMTEESLCENTDFDLSKSTNRNGQTNEPIPDRKPDTNPDIESADALIDYLNAKAGKRFRHTKTNRDRILPRLHDGFTQEDCQKVIDTMVSHWKGDETMDGYLRPETLFRASKFESYLNMKPKRSENDLDGYVYVDGQWYDKRTAPA